MIFGVIIYDRPKAKVLVMMTMPDDDKPVCYLVLHFMTMMMMVVMVMPDDDNQVCYLVLHFMIDPRQRC